MKDKRVISSIGANAILTIGLLLLFMSPAKAYDPHKNGDFTLGEFAAICMQTEGDAQDSSVYETLCELYLAGYTHALMQQPEKWCFPQQENWLDEIRWAFTPWYYANINLKNNPTSSAIGQFFTEHYRCNN